MKTNLNPLNTTFDIFKMDTTCEESINPHKTTFTTLELDIINKCNLKCPMCLRQEEPQSTTNPKLLSLFDIKYLFENQKDNEQFQIGLVRIVGVVSEPLLHPNLPEIVELINEYGATVFISTNGNINVQRNESYLHRLKMALNKNPLNEMVVALEAYDQEIYSIYRKGGQNKKIFELLDYMENRHFQMGIQFIKFPWNQNQDTKIKENIPPNKYDFFEVLYSNEPQDLDSDYRATDDITKGFYLKRKQINNLIDKKIDFKCSDKDIICVSNVYGELFVDTRGYIYPCTNLFENKTIPPKHISEKDCLETVKEMMCNRTKTKECYKACSVFGHKLEKNFKRERHYHNDEY